MSVTESKQKRSVNSRKSVKTQETPVCPAGADGGSERAAGLLIKSPLNVRTVPYSRVRQRTGGVH